jgi:hypothetical protein
MEVDLITDYQMDGSKKSKFGGLVGAHYSQLPCCRVSSARQWRPYFVVAPSQQFSSFISLYDFPSLVS